MGKDKNHTCTSVLWHVLEDTADVSMPRDSVAFFFCAQSGEFSISDHDLDILHPFGMKIRSKT